MLIATSLVMLMIPAGLALFYGGLTQNKSVLNTIGMTYVAFCTGKTVWIVIGYTLAFTERIFLWFDLNDGEVIVVIHFHFGLLLNLVILYLRKI